MYKKEKIKEEMRKINLQINELNKLPNKTIETKILLGKLQKRYYELEFDLLTLD